MPKCVMNISIYFYDYVFELRSETQRRLFVFLILRVVVEKLLSKL